MRANHCRGIVTNHIVVQNRRGLRPEEISRMSKCWHDLDSADNRCKGGMTLNKARIRNRGNSSKKREESHKLLVSKVITPVLDEWRINS